MISLKWFKAIYKKTLDKTCFAHDPAYSGRKDLSKRTISDQILKNRAYEIAINAKMVVINPLWCKVIHERASVNVELAQ